MASKRNSRQSMIAVLTGYDVAASVAGSLWRQVARFPDTLRKVGGVQKDDGYRPAATDPHERFLEAMAFYGSSPEKLPRLISNSYKEFYFHAVAAAVSLVIAILLSKSSLYMAFSFGLIALFFAARALRSTVDNWVLRNQRTASLREIFKAPDLLPQKEA